MIGGVERVPGAPSLELVCTAYAGNVGRLRRIPGTHHKFIALPFKS